MDQHRQQLYHKPKGEIIAGPVEGKEETLYADINLAEIISSKRMFDAAGHYARPDIFKFSINRKPNNNIDSLSLGE